MATLERINQLALHEQAGTSNLADYACEQFDNLLNDEAADITVPTKYKYGFEYYCDRNGLPCLLIEMRSGCFAISKSYAALAEHEEER